MGILTIATHIPTPDHGHLVGNMRTPEPLAAPALPDLVSPETPGALHTLFLATGGAGGSWAPCILPFGALAVLAGAAGTGITFSLCGPSLDLAQSMSLAALGAGLGLLTATFLCWRTRRRRRRRAGLVERREPGAP